MHALILRARPLLACDEDEDEEDEEDEPALGGCGIPAAPRGFGVDARGVTRVFPPAPEGSEARVGPGSLGFFFFVCGRLWCGREVGNRRRVGDFAWKSLGRRLELGEWGRGGKVGAEPGAQRDAPGGRWRRTNPPQAAEGARPGPACPQGKRPRISGHRAGLRLSPALSLSPEPGPALRFPRAFGGVGARLNCENRDFLPAEGGSRSLSKPCPARNGPAPGGDTQGTPWGHQSFLLHYIAEMFPMASLGQSFLEPFSKHFNFVD